jgi:glycosyltransferase involved in cell wall biosynthesis
VRIAIVAEPYPPMRSSGAVQIRDLSREFARQGHEVTVLVPAPDQREAWKIEEDQGVEVIRLKALRTRDTPYVRRTFGEFLMPFAMLRNLRKSPFADREFDGIVWYSPTIFLGPIVKALKKPNRCPSYLVLRDIFPEWAADIGLMSRGVPFRFFKKVANFQYSVATTIGVQTPGNLHYFAKGSGRPGKNVEVLQNWLAEPINQGCSINISKTRLAGRRIFVYAGNMGVAQGAGKFLHLAEEMSSDPSVGFVFVGRGSDAELLRCQAEVLGLANVLFFDEIDPDEMPGLFAQCHAGLVALDQRHKTHNIPGKFIAYMHSGLPVLASINSGNDLEKLVTEKGVGRVSILEDGDDLSLLLRDMLACDLTDGKASNRCLELAKELFSAAGAVKQIVSAMERTQHSAR